LVLINYLLNITYCKDGGEPIHIVENKLFEYGRHTHYFPDTELFSRDKNVIGTVLTISANERESGGSYKEITINVGSELKSPTDFGFESKISTNPTTKISSGTNDEFMGRGYLYFWYNAEYKDIILNSDVKMGFRTAN